MEKKTIRIHRLGSVTFGVVLLVLGILFTIHVIAPRINLLMAFRLWPLVLILLGIEVLIGCRYKSYKVIKEDGQVVEQCKVVYDVPAILMMVCTLFLTLGLAWAEWIYVNEGYFWM